MENVPGEMLYVFECVSKDKHRITRRTIDNNAMCSRCGKPFKMIGETQKNAGETDISHNMRALTMKAVVVH